MPYLTGWSGLCRCHRQRRGIDSTQVHFGWTAGAGVEIAVAEQISL